LQKGEKFGETSLYYNTVRLCQAKAKERTICLVIGHEHLATLKDIDPPKHFLNVYAKSILENVATIKNNLKKADIDLLMNFATLGCYQSGHVLVDYGASFDYLHILIEGSLKTLDERNNPLTQDREKTIWGEFRLGEDPMEKRLNDDTIVVAVDSVIMSLPIKLINEKLGLIPTKKVNSLVTP
jgi:hypothetical protein